MKFWNAFRISTKINIATITLLIFFATITVFYSISESSKNFKQEAYRQLEVGARTFITETERKKNSALNAALWFENSARLIKGIEANDRSEVIELIKLGMKSFGVDYVVVTDKEGKVLARAHEPEKFGDNINKQVNISKALKGEQSVGIEDGAIVKLSIRAASPIKKTSGEIVGAISIGYYVASNKLLDELKNQLNLEMSVFSQETRVATTLEVDGKRLLGTKIQDENLLNEVLKNGKDFRSTSNIQGIELLTYYVPIKDVSGSITGIAVNCAL